MIALSSDIVITGVGALGCFGGSSELLWKSLQADRPCLSLSSRLPTMGVCAHVGDWFNLDDYKRSRQGRRAPLISQYALAVASQAIRQAKIDVRGACEKDEVAIVYGTGNGPNGVLERNLSAIIVNGLAAVEPLSFQESVFNAPASLISIEYGFRGPLLALPMGWAAGGYAMATAADLIQFGHADTVLVVVSDEMSTVGNSAMRALRLISPQTDPDRIHRPYSRCRDGASYGEGAAAVVIERASVTAARGNTGVVPLAYMCGWSMASDAHGTGPKRTHDGILSAMSRSIDMAGGISPDIVFGGGYSTMDSDLVEARAISEFFGACYNIPVTNIRGTIGEAKAATALFNVIAAIKAMRTEHLPGTLGTDPLDPDCEIDVIEPKGRTYPARSALCNSFWVNGTNSSLVLSKAKAA